MTAHQVVKAGSKVYNAAMDGKVAIVILACASPPYDKTIQAIRTTWGSKHIAGADIYYLYGNAENEGAKRVIASHLGHAAPRVAADKIYLSNNVLIAGCSDHMSQQADCLLRKRLIAFDYLANRNDYRQIYTVCATSYVDQSRMLVHAKSLTNTLHLAGPMTVNQESAAPLISGASMLLSIDLARQLGKRRNEIIEQNRFGFRDDVAIGHWVATNVSLRPVRDIIKAMPDKSSLSAEYVFVSCVETSADFVVAAPERHRPRHGVFHYHFHSRKPHDMVNFHAKHFAGTT